MCGYALTNHQDSGAVDLVLLKDDPEYLKKLLMTCYVTGGDYQLDEGVHGSNEFTYGASGNARNRGKVRPSSDTIMFGGQRGDEVQKAIARRAGGRFLSSEFVETAVRNIVLP